MRSKSSTLSPLALSVALVTALGCGGRQEPTDTDEALRERVTSYWDLKVQRDVVKMYDYLEQSFREKTSLVDYVSSVNRDLKYFTYRIDSMEREGDRATVKVSYTWQLPDYALRGLKPSPRLMEDVPEVWKLENRVWHRVVEDGSPTVAHTSRTRSTGPSPKTDGEAPK